MNNYREKALSGLNDVVVEIKPQAEAADDEETLELIEELDNLKEEGKAMAMVEKLRELKDRAEKQGYSVDV